MQVNPPFITVVCGFPRSGTSLTMRMLHVGGLEVVAENHYAYEDERTLGKLDWLSEVQGKAIKVLVQGKLPPAFPTDLRYRFIWLNRDPVEQAKSQAKLVHAISGISIRIGKAAAMIRGDRYKCVHRLWRYPGSKVLELNFEDLINDPVISAQKIQAFLPEISLNVEAMASVVVPRSTDCYDGFLELTLQEIQISRLKEAS